MPVVAVPPPQSSFNDLSAYVQALREAQAGTPEQYLHWLEHELIPSIERASVRIAAATPAQARREHPAAESLFQALLASQEKARAHGHTDLAALLQKAADGAGSLEATLDVRGSEKAMRARRSYQHDKEQNTIDAVIWSPGLIL